MKMENKMYAALEAAGIFFDRVLDDCVIIEQQNVAAAREAVGSDMVEKILVHRGDLFILKYDPYTTVCKVGKGGKDVFLVEEEEEGNVRYTSTIEEAVMPYVFTAPGLVSDALGLGEGFFIHSRNDEDPDGLDKDIFEAEYPKFIPASMIDDITSWVDDEFGIECKLYRVKEGADVEGTYLLVSCQASHSGEDFLDRLAKSGKYAASIHDDANSLPAEAIKYIGKELAFASGAEFYCESCVLDKSEASLIETRAIPAGESCRGCGMVLNPGPINEDSPKMVTIGEVLFDIETGLGSEGTTAAAKWILSFARENNLVVHDGRAYRYTTGFTERFDKLAGMVPGPYWFTGEAAVIVEYLVKNDLERLVDDVYEDGSCAKFWPVWESRQKKLVAGIVDGNGLVCGQEGVYDEKENEHYLSNEYY